MKKYSLLITALILSNVAQATPILAEHTTDEDATELFINLDMNGQPLRFALDTGSDFTSLANDKQTAKFFTLGHGTSIGASGKPQTCDVVAPPDFTLDGQKLEIPIATRCKANPINNLGLDVLDGKIVNLNFAAMEFNFLPEAPENLQPVHKLDSSFIALPVTIGGQTLAALFDTGAGMTLVSSRYVKKHPDQFTPGFNSGVMTDLTGKKMQVKGYRLKSIQIGDVLFNDVLVAAYDSHGIKDLTGEDLPVVLGNNIITKANWTFDLKNYRWAVTK